MVILLFILNMKMTVRRSKRHSFSMLHETFIIIITIIIIIIIILSPNHDQHSISPYHITT